MHKHMIGALLALSVIATPASALAGDLRLGLGLDLRLRGEEARQEYKEKMKDARQEYRDQREDARGQLKERKASASAELKTRLSANAKERIKAWWTRVQRRLTAVIDRLTKLADKIAARLDRLAAAGHDMTKQKSDLAAARVKIDSAKQELASASAQVTLIVDSQEPKEAFAKLRSLHKDVLAAIREAHRALVLILGSTRGLGVTPSPSVSPTATP